jgi:hypothetical protein
MSEIISLFIDDEMELDEKIVFVEAVQNNPSFAAETIELLSIEKQIRADVVEQVPLLEPVRPGILKKLSGFFREPLGWTATALAAALIALILTTLPSSETVFRQSRFVIYKPEVRRVEIAGSFTNWERIPLYRAGDSGYWELTLVLPEGEHHFSYILEGRQRIADPTIRIREPDDFGGYNSILHVGDTA